jgi:D-glycerate 3-kinase
MPRHAHPPAAPGFNPGFNVNFVAAMLDDALAHGGRIHGITGLQGTGKSTLAAQMAALAGERGLRAAVLSIDDVYLRRAQRQALARDVHPLLATRGPPGTHDLALACETLDALRDGRATVLPRFDKLADDRLARIDWPQVEHADLVLFEGWFLRTPPQDDEALVAPLNALEREEDSDGTWRRYCNDTLGRDYPALWKRIDQLLLLQGPGFDIVPAWRWQQEQQLQANHPRRMAMTHAQVERFVQFFERTSRQAMRTLPAIATRTVRLDASRNPL